MQQAVLTLRTIICMQEFFKVAVSFCGNHDNRGYNAGWGETYHGPLVVNEDSNVELHDNYESASNQYYAKNLVGKLLLIHGTMDGASSRSCGYSGLSDGCITFTGMSRCLRYGQMITLLMLLTSGEMDENVHFSLSMKVANELIKENKDFDMLIVPNSDHSGVYILSLQPIASLPAVVVLPRQNL